MSMEHERQTGHPSRRRALTSRFLQPSVISTAFVISLFVLFYSAPSFISLNVTSTKQAVFIDDDSPIQAAMTYDAPAYCGEDCNDKAAVQHFPFDNAQLATLTSPMQKQHITALVDLALRQAATKGAWGKALTVVFWSPGTASELVRNNVYSMVQYGGADSFIVLTWTESDLLACQKLNFPCNDGLEYVLAASIVGESGDAFAKYIAWAKLAVVLRLLEEGFTVHATDADLAWAPKDIWSSFQAYLEGARPSSVDGAFPRRFQGDINFDTFLVLPSQRTLRLWRNWTASAFDALNLREDTLPLSGLEAFIPGNLVVTCESVVECTALEGRRNDGTVPKDTALFRLYRPAWYPKPTLKEELGGIRLKDNQAYCGSDADNYNITSFDPCSPFLLHVKPVCQEGRLDEAGRETEKTNVLKQLGMWFVAADNDYAWTALGDHSTAVIEAGSSLPDRFKDCENKRAFVELEKDQSADSDPAEMNNADTVDKEGAHAITDSEMNEIRPDASYLEAVAACKTLACLKNAHTRNQSVGQFNFPHAMIVGYPKCATTSLYTYLENDNRTKVSVPKEPEFFTTDCRTDPVHGCPLERQANYLEYTLQRHEFVASNGTTMHFEASTHYGMKGDVIAAGIREMMPWVKIIISLREPISRAASMLVHNLGKRRGCFAEASTTLFHCLIKDSHLVERPETYQSYLNSRHGNYSYALDAWLHEFPTDQVHTVQYEILVAQDAGSEAELRRMKEFLDLGIEVSTEEHLAEENMRVDRFRSEGWPMRRSEYQQLVDMVRPDAEAVARLVESVGQGNAGEWLARWARVWEGNLSNCDSHGNCKIRLS